jgi:NAD(P)H-hydrate epimerase
MRIPNSALPTDVYRAAQTRELDRLAIQDYGIPGLCLMERAGAACFSLLRQRWPAAGKIGVVCGLGNNAGDGYVIARLAHIAGCAVQVWQVGDAAKLQGDALSSWRNLLAVGVTPQPFQSLAGVDVVVDALLGTGLDRPLQGAWREAVEAVNASGLPAMAVDIPSGLHADTGAVLGVAVQADVTVSFIGLKLGLFTGQGPACCGQIYFDGLQVPAAARERIRPAAERLDRRIAQSIPPRPRSAHKGDFGHVLIVGGEHGYSGAAQLAGSAAARAGAGKISIATRASHAGLLNLTQPELMCHGVESRDELQALLDSADVVAAGPGLGRGLWGRSLLQAVLDCDKPLVLDADALNLLAEDSFPSLDRRLEQAVLTPHPGEAGRLLQISTATVEADRPAAATAIQARFGGVCVLKGAGTLISDGAALAVCNAGNPGMACGGMGDVLSGVIAALLGQGYTPLDAARIGVCLHAAAGDLAAQDGERGLLPSDVIAKLRGF